MCNNRVISFVRTVRIIEHMSKIEQPTMNRRERQVQERRNTILSAALQLFENKGYLETSMEEIAETADVARGTLYNHFESKAEVLLALTNSVSTQWLAKGEKELALSHSAKNAIREVLGTAAEWFDKHPASARAFFYAMRELISKANECAAPHSLTPLPLVVQAQEDGELTKELAPELLVLIIDSVLKQHLINLLTKEKTGNFAKEARREVDFLLEKFAP